MECINYTPWRWPFKGWNTSELGCNVNKVMIPWYMSACVSVRIWYFDIISQTWLSEGPVLNFQPDHSNFRDLSHFLQWNTTPVHQIMPWPFLSRAFHCIIHERPVIERCLSITRNTERLFVIKPTRCTNFTNLFCHETLHFRTVRLSIIRGSFTVHSEMVQGCW
jgi:hypothetical protein